MIKNEVLNGKINIFPFNHGQINPNSYNYRLGNELLQLSAYGSHNRLELDGNQWLLRAGKSYLGATLESIGSDRYAMSLIGRSSMGRLGLFVQISANLGHVGSSHCWTLELFSSKDIILYPGMIIGQVSFWYSTKSASPYMDGYSKFSTPTPSRITRS